MAFLTGLWDGFLSEDIATKAQGRLVVNLTEVSGFKARSVLTSQFTSRQDLLDVLLAATGIVGVSMRDCWHFIRGSRYCDGAFTDLAPQLQANTVLISPFRSFQPKCFRDAKAYVISPSAKRQQKGSPVPKERGFSFMGLLLGPIWKVITVCGTPQTLAVCQVEARHGYEDAAAAREMLLHAGWKPRQNPCTNKYDWGELASE